MAKKMKVHKLKTLPRYFESIVNGTKPFEIRKNDRNFEVGDILRLEEYDSYSKGRNKYNRVRTYGGYTGRFAYVEISYILTDLEYCKKGYAVLGIILIGSKEG